MKIAQDEIKQKLKWGDLPRIAEMTGLSRSMVEKVLVRGVRKNARVTQAAVELIGLRERYQSTTKTKKRGGGS